MGESAASDRPARAFLLAALALLALPVLSVRVPLMLDYPNHFARIWLLAGGAQAPPASEFYAVDLANISTNMGVDLLTVVLGVALPASVLGPFFSVAALVLPPLGAALLNRALFGGWHWWQVGFAALAWSATLLGGFLNFQIGLGLALLAATLDPAAARRRVAAAAAIRAGVAAVLLFIHPFALLFYVAVLTGIAFGPGWGTLGSGRALKAGAARILAAAGAAVVPLVAALLFAPVLPWDDAGSVPGTAWAPFSLRHKLGLLLTSVRNYHLPVDVALVALAGAPAAWALAVGKLRVHAGLLLTAAGLAALLFVAPYRLGGVGWIQERFPTMALLALAAALRPELRLSRRAGATLAGALLGVSAVRTALVGVVWHERQADVAAVERVLAHLPVGASLLPMEHTPADGLRLAPRGRYTVTGGVWRGDAHGNYWHYPVLAVPWRRAFVPTLFARRGNQPIRILPPWDDLAAADFAFPLTVAALRAEDPTRFPFQPEWFRHFSHHLAGWRERYQYVLVLNADMPDGDGPARAVPGLELVADAGFAQLHRVHRLQGSAAAAD